MSEDRGISRCLLMAWRKTAETPVSNGGTVIWRQAILKLRLGFKRFKLLNRCKMLLVFGIPVKVLGSSNGYQTVGICEFGKHANFIVTLKLCADRHACYQISDQMDLYIYTSIELLRKSAKDYSMCYNWSHNFDNVLVQLLQRLCETSSNCA